MQSNYFTGELTRISARARASHSRLCVLPTFIYATACIDTCHALYATCQVSEGPMAISVDASWGGYNLPPSPMISRHLP